MRALLLLLCVFTSLLGGSGCSSYGQRWKEYGVAHPSKSRSGDVHGSYEGTWRSARYKSADGKLWCILQPDGPNHYLAEFRATWHGVFNSEHKIRLQVTRRSRVHGVPKVEFTGETEIRMWVGSGHYRCSGTILGDTLTANYDASYDAGQFHLRRATIAVPSSLLRNEQALH